MKEFLSDKTILVCEDNALNAKIVQYMLQEKGAVVICAANGVEAVEQFEKSVVGSIAGILMDIRMPLCNGIEAAKRIRSLNRKDAKEIPIIALTADVTAVYEEAIEAGMTGMVTKPLDMNKFYQILEKQIRG